MIFWKWYPLPIVFGIPYVWATLQWSAERYLISILQIMIFSELLGFGSLPRQKAFLFLSTIFVAGLHVDVVLREQKKNFGRNWTCFLFDNGVFTSNPSVWRYATMKILFGCTLLKRWKTLPEITLVWHDAAGPPSHQCFMCTNQPTKKWCLT